MRALCAAALGCLVSFGCSDSSSTGSGGSASTTSAGKGATSGTGAGGGASTDTPDDFAKAFCGLIGNCCAAHGKAKAEADCIAHYAPLASFEAFHASRATACVEIMREYAAAHAGFCLEPSLVGICAQVFGGKVGTAKPGEACNQDIDCGDVPGAEVWCRMPLDMTNTAVPPGICQVLRRGAAGDACTASLEDGGIYFIDRLFGAPTPAAQSASCSRAGGLYCDVSTKVCTKTIAQDGACSFDAVCTKGSPSCLPGPDPCALGTWCDGKTCRAAAADGASCDTSGPTTCVPDARCNGKGGAMGTCIHVAAPGEACTDDKACAGYGGTCSGTCMGSAPQFDAICSGNL